MKKHIHTLILGLAALCAPGRYSTANAKPDDAPPAPPEPAASAADLAALAEQFAALKEENAELRRANEAKDAAPAEQPSSELAMLAKGAGLADLSDVSWRVRAGLTAKQAVDAALAQIAADKLAEATAAEAAKAAKAKGK